MVGIGGVGAPFPDDAGSERVRKPLLVGLSIAMAAVVVVAGIRLATASEGAGLKVTVAAQDREAVQSEGGDRAMLVERAGATADAAKSDGEGDAGTVPAPASGGDGSPAASASSSAEGTIFVHIGGCVASPGVYELPSGSRISDAVGAAGGFAENAAPDALNLARALADGERVIVPSAEDYARAGATASAELGAEADGGAIADGALRGGAIPGSGAQIGKVNINAASADELQALPGIGPAIAQKIVASRQSEGPFETCEDLMRVSGIGQKKYDGLADSICVG